MKVINMTSGRGNPAPNQFIIEMMGPCVRETLFQSYKTIICKVVHAATGDNVFLDRDMWDYSKTTGIYRNQFLNETIKETRAKIASGEYQLTNLNGE